MTKHERAGVRLYRLRAAGRDGRAAAEGRADRVRRRRHPAAGRHAGAAQLRAAPDHPVRGRHHRPFIVPGELPPSTNEQRCTRRANMVLPITDVLLLLQRGYVDVGFMGGAQIDRFGNLNSSFIGDADNPEDRGCPAPAAATTSPRSPT